MSNLYKSDIAWLPILGWELVLVSRIVKLFFRLPEEVAHHHNWLELGVSSGTGPKSTLYDLHTAI